MEKSNWLYCPICHNKTRLKIRKDTLYFRYPYTIIISQTNPKIRMYFLGIYYPKSKLGEFL